MTNESIEQLMLISNDINFLEGSDRLGSDEIYVVQQIKKRIQKIKNNEL